MFLHLFVILLTVATEAGGTHPTGMHTCYIEQRHRSKNKIRFCVNFRTLQTYTYHQCHRFSYHLKMGSMQSCGGVYTQCLKDQRCRSQKYGDVDGTCKRSLGDYLWCKGFQKNTPPPENWNLGRPWHFEFWLQQTGLQLEYVESNRCIPQRYHLVFKVFNTLQTVTRTRLRLRTTTRRSSRTWSTVNTLTTCCSRYKTHRVWGTE